MVLVYWRNYKDVSKPAFLTIIPVKADFTHFLRVGQTGQGLIFAGKQTILTSSP